MKQIITSVKQHVIYLQSVSFIYFLIESFLRQQVPKNAITLILEMISRFLYRCYNVITIVKKQVFAGATKRWGPIR